MSRRYWKCTSECGVKRLSCCCSLRWTPGTADVKAVGCLLRPVKASYFCSRAASEWTRCLLSTSISSFLFKLKKKSSHVVFCLYSFTHCENATLYMTHTHSTEYRCLRLTPTSLLGLHWVFLVLGASTEWRRLRTHGTFALSLLKSKLNPGDLGAADRLLIELKIWRCLFGQMAQ